MKFNSLDAQWESCSSYIRSMSGLGWRLIEKHYDDGGFSGGNTQRPALTELLKDIDEAPAVQMAFERYAATGSSFQVANELNASSYKRPEGCVWVSRHVMKILKNPLYIGKVVYQRTGEVFDGIHDPLISQERYDYVNEMIKKRGGGPRKGREPMFSPLTGLLRCGKCGRAMVPTTSRCKPGTLKRYFYYRCSRRTKGYDVKCDTPIMPADVIERIVREKLNPVLNSEAVVNAVAGPLPDARAEYAVMIANGPAFWDAMEPSERVKLFKTLVKEVKVFADHIEIVFTFDKAVLSVPIEQKWSEQHSLLGIE